MEANELIYLRNGQMDVTICLEECQFQGREHFKYWERHYRDRGYRDLTATEQAALARGEYQVRKWRLMTR